MNLLELSRIVILRLNGHVHLDKTVIASRGVLVVISLIFAHVTSAHAAVLFDEPLLKLLIQSIVGHFESLN